ncbi:pyridoxal phosphate-dependent transferase [Dipodascopsis uninucleata]
MPSIERPPTAIGCPIPANTPHAVSVTLPSWKATVAYEKGEDWVIGKMTSGYPRFFYHVKIQELCAYIVKKYGNKGEAALVLPSYKVACKCRAYMERMKLSNDPITIRVVEITLPGPSAGVQASISSVFFPESEAPIAKSFWQHTGDGVSSRMAEYALERLIAADSAVENKTPVAVFKSRAGSLKRYTRKIDQVDSVTSDNDSSDSTREFSTFLEERFGRNLDISFVELVKVALRRRISGTMDDNLDVSQISQSVPQQSSRDVKSLSEKEVFLYPTGMSAIFNSHQLLLECLVPKKSICFGFPYIDTLKILHKWGPGVHFYGNGESEDLDSVERLLEGGEKILALYCEFPSNPLLKSPDLHRIRRLADKYDFVVVVDETVSNFINIHVLEYADIVVSSLTKIFSGDSNVMGGSLVLSPLSKHFNLFKKTLQRTYEDNLWAEDAIFLERNSRDFVSRAKRININAEALCKVFEAEPKIKEIYYPKYGSTKKFYDVCKTEDGGYGGLLSILMHDPEDSKRFFDAVEAAKGPSLGTNFTLLCPYTILAHYAELDWAAKYGVDRYLIRISVGLEPTEELVAIFEKYLKALYD